MRVRQIYLFVLYVLSWLPILTMEKGSNVAGRLQPRNMRDSTFVPFSYDQAYCNHPLFVGVTPIRAGLNVAQFSQ